MRWIAVAIAIALAVDAAVDADIQALTCCEEGAGLLHLQTAGFSPQEKGH